MVWPVLLVYSLLICLSIYVMKFKYFNEKLDQSTKVGSEGVKLHHIGLVPI